MYVKKVTEKIFKKFDKLFEYESNPIKLIWQTKTKLLPFYLWCIFFIVEGFIIFGNYKKWLEISQIHMFDFLGVSISGLSFALVIVSAALGIYREEELVILYGEQGRRKNIDGIQILEYLAPYVFTILLFLIIGILSIIGSMLVLESENIIYIITHLFMGTIVLGILSLFNIAYTILMDLFYSIQRKSLLKVKQEEIKKNRKHK